MKNKYAKNLWLLMLPLIGSNILQQLYNTIDSIIISRFTNALNFAAVGVASSVMNLFFSFDWSLYRYFGALLTKLWKKDMDTFHRIFFQSLVFGTLASVLLAIFGIVGLPMILSLIDVPTHLVPLTKTYLIVIFIALPTTYLYNICSALMRSIGHSKTVLIILMISVLANTGLDLFLVAYWKQGIFGAAFDTALSQCVSAILSLWTIKHRFSWLMFTRKDCIFDRKMLYLILSIDSTLGFPTSAVVWMTCLCRLERSTTSASTIPIFPTPAAAR